jgi:ABC-2 type transport system permease protein
MKNILDLAKIFLVTSRIRINRSMQYRFDFIAGLLVSCLLSFLGPLFQYLIFQKSSGYINWNTDQIILYQGVMVFWYGLKDSLFGEVRSNFEQICRNGLFDMLLLKPFSAIGIVLTRGAHYQSFSAIVVGLGLIGSSVHRMSLDITAVRLLLFAGFMLTGLVFYTAIMIFYCIITVKLVYTNRLSEILDKLMIFSQFPTDIYFPVVRTLFIVVFPLALWVFFPAQALLNRLNGLIIPGVFSSLAGFFLSLFLWDRTLKKYTSAGG